VEAVAALHTHHPQPSVQRPPHLQMTSNPSGVQQQGVLTLHRQFVQGKREGSWVRNPVPLDQRRQLLSCRPRGAMMPPLVHAGVGLVAANTGAVKRRLVRPVAVNVCMVAMILQGTSHDLNPIKIQGGRARTASATQSCRRSRQASHLCGGTALALRCRACGGSGAGGNGGRSVGWLCTQIHKLFQQLPGSCSPATKDTTANS
jgi:hypothetical protein